MLGRLFFALITTTDTHRPPKGVTFLHEMARQAEYSRYCQRYEYPFGFFNINSVQIVGLLWSYTLGIPYKMAVIETVEKTGLPQ